MSLATLPPELYTSILSCVPSQNRQATTLNLSRAIPHSPVPLHNLFQHVIISRQEQAPQLYRRLCNHPTLDWSGNETQIQQRAWVKSLTLQTWQIDPDILVNLLKLFPATERLSLVVGAVFSPEHLEEIFKNRAMAVDALSLRFRSYVQKATYYQFLKGSYFDTTLQLLSHWPSRLLHLSIIQDPPPPVPSDFKSFAQPIVFFSFVPLTILSLSPASQNITHLRLRIPSRQLVRFICSSQGNTYSGASHFPSLVYIDLSTCAVHELSEIEALLIYTGRGQLKHIVLDETGLCNGSEGEWELLGRSCALVGVRRMREREKALKAWVEAESSAQSRSEEVLDSGHPLRDGNGRRARPGRRGLATATVSLRDTGPQDPMITHAIRPVVHSGRASNTVKIRVLPPPPSILSLSVSLSRPSVHPYSVDMEMHQAKARSDFAKGWSDGLSQLRAIRTRLRQSQSNGVRVVRFKTEYADPPIQVSEVSMLDDLVDMGKPGVDDYWEGLREVGSPVLCFAGEQDEEDRDCFEEVYKFHHPEGCGHRISRDLWGGDQ